MVAALVGAVLCGGRSSRMGHDKALMTYAGAPMVVRVTGALRAGGCTDVVAVGGEGVALAALGLTFVADGYPGEGPVGGVITALRHFADHDAVFVAACDLPCLSGAAVQLVAGSLTGHDVAIAVADRPQPLCAVWRPRVVIDLLRAFDSGERSMRGVMHSLSVATVTVPALDLVNVNAADDLPR